MEAKRPKLDKYRAVKPRFITIDLDLEDKPLHLERVIRVLRVISLCSRVKCVIKRSKKGYHIYIPIEDYDFEKAIHIRALIDDKMRLEIDVKRYYKGLHRWVETLFNCKRQEEYSYCEEESSLDELWRKYINGWWPF